jgi:hypothetical protein
VGWIDFAPTSGYPAGNPQTAAHYNSVTGQITGWAKILSLGDDGWLKMRKDASGIGEVDYGVSINSSGDFSGWAWNGGGIGWVSFNAKDCDTNGNNFLDIACGGDDTTITYIDYKVHADLNQPPTTTGLTAPNWNYSNACFTEARQAFLRWTFSDSDSGASQSAYQVIVDDDSDFGSSIVDTNKTSGAATQYNLTSANLSYNTAYYWKVKVWDDKDVASDWIEYNAVSDTDNNDENNLTFTTYLHEFPDVYFSWLPEKPSQDENVTFSDVDLEDSRTSYYIASSPSSPTDCNSSNCNFNWTIQDASEVNVADKQNPIYKFTSSGSKSAALKVTDGDGYYCDKTQAVQVNVALPTWKETKK